MSANVADVVGGSRAVARRVHPDTIASRNRIKEDDAKQKRRHRDVAFYFTVCVISVVFLLSLYVLIIWKDAPTDIRGLASGALNTMVGVLLGYMIAAVTTRKE